MGIEKQRPLPPEIFTDEALVELPLELKWTAVGLRMYADDHGRNSVNLLLLKSSIHPLTPKITTRVIQDHVLTLADLGYIVLYPHEDRMLYAMAKWLKISHPEPSRWPAPPPELFQNRSGTEHDGFSAEEREGESERESERERESDPGRDPTRNLLGAPPSQYCPAHRDSIGTLQPCRKCATYRERFREWERLQRAMADAALDEERPGHDD